MGAITNKSIAFRVRPWEIKNFNFYDITNVECHSIRIEHRDLEILRVTPNILNGLSSFYNEKSWLTNFARFYYLKYNVNRLGSSFLNIFRYDFKLSMDLSWLQVLEFFWFILLKLKNIFKQNILFYFKNFVINPSFLLWVLNDTVDLSMLSIIKNFNNIMFSDSVVFMVNNGFGTGGVNFDVLDNFYKNKYKKNTIFLNSFDKLFTSVPKSVINFKNYRKSFENLRFNLFDSFVSLLSQFKRNKYILHLYNFTKKNNKLFLNVLHFIIGKIPTIFVGKDPVCVLIDDGDSTVNFSLSLFTNVLYNDLNSLLNNNFSILPGNLSSISIFYLSLNNFLNTFNLYFINLININLFILFFELRKVYNKIFFRLNSMFNYFFINFLYFNDKDILGLHIPISSDVERSLKFINIFNNFYRVTGKIAMYGKARSFNKLLSLFIFKSE